MEEKIVYFDKPGKGNTPEVIKLVKERAQARGINQFVVASTRGSTARDFMEAVLRLRVRGLERIRLSLPLLRRLPG
jgi:uncharacterized protein